jgi:hypothetical protein
MRVAAIEVSHWHSLYDAAYLRILSGLPGVELVGLHDPDAEVAAKRARELGEPPVFTDYREMLDKTKPDLLRNDITTIDNALNDCASALALDRPSYDCAKCNESRIQFFAHRLDMPGPADFFYCCNCGSSCET